MKFIKTILFLLFLGLFFQTVCLAQEVSFIHITDINLDKSNAPKVLQTIREINTYEDVDFVVFGGDNIAKADIDNLDMFLYILSQVKKKCIVLLGSNDVSTTSEIDKEYYLKRVWFVRKTKHSKKPNYTFKCKDVVFVVMDGSKQYFPGTNGCYTTKELKWLDETLTKYKNDDVIILQHFPLLDTKSKWLKTAKIENYQEVLKKHNNVRMIVSGHYGPDIEKKTDGIYHIVTESYSKNGAYEIIQVNFKDDFVGTYLVK